MVQRSSLVRLVSRSRSAASSLAPVDWSSILFYEPSVSGLKPRVASLSASTREARAGPI